MRRLIISNTHYQTIIAIQLKITLFKSDDVVLLISDHSSNSDRIASNIEKSNLFEKVMYFESRDIIYNRTKKQEWRDFFDLAFGKNNRYVYYLDHIDNIYFDELLVYNYEVDIYALYTVLAGVNPKITISVFEEGISAYSFKEFHSKKIDLACMIRKIVYKNNIKNARGNFYCFYPQLYEGEYTPFKIPLIEKNDEYISILCQAFGVNRSKLKYKEKYIFFTSVCDFEGAPIGETELVLKIADMVGLDNLLVKVHPRDRRDIFTGSGLHIDNNSYVPWEVIQLCVDFSNSVFLTATSGSVLAGSFLTERHVKTFYLYDMCNVEYNEVAKNSVENINKLINDKRMKDIFDNVIIARNVEEIYE